MIEKKEDNIGISYRYKCDFCNKGYLVANRDEEGNLIKDVTGRYENMCTNCFQIYYKLESYPYMEVKENGNKEE